MGNQQSLLKEEEIRELMKSTPFSRNDINNLQKRYAEFISAKEKSEVMGLTLEECMMIPEFSCHNYIHLFMSTFLNENNLLNPYQFIQLCGVVSSKTPVNKKRLFLYESLDINKTAVLSYQEVFRLLKYLFGKGLSDDHLLDMTSQILHDESLSTIGEIQMTDLDRLITDRDIKNRMTIDFFFT